MILNHRLVLTQHDKWLVTDSLKTLQTSPRGLNLSIKTFHSEKLANVLCWKWKQCTGIMKRISVTFGFDSESQIFFAGSKNKLKT